MRVFVNSEHPFFYAQSLFPEGLPLKDELEYQLPCYHNKGWKNWIGRLTWFFDNLKWGEIVFSDPDEIDPPFYLLDTSKLSFEQYQALAKIYRQIWEKSPELVNVPDPLAFCAIHVSSFDLVSMNNWYEEHE
jgi:hypothetical protein